MGKWYDVFDGNFWIVIAGIASPLLIMVIKHRIECCGRRGWFIMEPTENNPHAAHKDKDIEAQLPLLTPPTPNRMSSRVPSNSSEIELELSASHTR